MINRTLKQVTYNKSIIFCKSCIIDNTAYSSINNKNQQVLPMISERISYKDYTYLRHSKERSLLNKYSYEPYKVKYEPLIYATFKQDS